VDFVFRVLGVEYLKRYDLAHVPPKEEQAELLNPTNVGAELGAMTNPPPPMDAPETQQALRFEAEKIGHSGSVLDKQLSEMMGDAPMCDTCGHITVRNGACYKCLNCGASMGCS